MRVYAAVSFLLALGSSSFGQGKPDWLKDPERFCAELAVRANGASSQLTVGRADPPNFGRYPVRPIASPRTQEAIIDKYAWMDKHVYNRQVREVAAEGPISRAVTLWFLEAAVHGVSTRSSLM